MKHFWLIVGMAVVTYIPRMLPMTFLSRHSVPPGVRSFLEFIPYTALGALIIPGAFKAIPGNPETAVIALGVAAMCAWFKGGLIISVLAAVFISFILMSF